MDEMKDVEGFLFYSLIHNFEWIVLLTERPIDYTVKSRPYFLIRIHVPESTENRSTIKLENPILFMGSILSDDFDNDLLREL